MVISIISRVWTILKNDEYRPHKIIIQQQIGVEKENGFILLKHCCNKNLVKCAIFAGLILDA